MIKILADEEEKRKYKGVTPTLKLINNTTYNEIILV